MKKNFILVAILLAVGVVNAAFFLDEMDNKAELRIDNLEMLAEGEVNIGLFLSTKIRFCKESNGDVDEYEKCTSGLNVVCWDEPCPPGTVEK